MSSLRPFRRLAAILFATTVAVGQSVIPVAAATPASPAATTQAKIGAYLTANPGGVQINAREISYGALIVTVTKDVGVPGTPDCPSGWFCFYEGTDYTYPRGKLSGCGWQDLGTWKWQNRIESVHNMATGTVGFLNETGATDTVLFRVGSHHALADVNPNRNRADYVSRTSC